MELLNNFQFVGIINIYSCENLTNILRIKTPILQSDLPCIISELDEISKSKLVEYISELIYNLNLISLTNGNLKPSNILFDENDDMYITDYFINSIRNLDNLKLDNYRYLSPEILNQNEITSSTDVWSFGCILYYIYNKSDYFNGDNKEIIINNITSHQYKKKSIKYSLLIKKCLEINSSKRPSIKEIRYEISNTNDNDILNKNIFLVIYNSINLTKELFEEIINNGEIIDRIIYEYNYKIHDIKTIGFFINLLWNCYSGKEHCYILSNIYFKVITTVSYNRYSTLYLDKMLLESVDKDFTLKLIVGSQILTSSSLNKEAALYIQSLFPYISNIKHLSFLQLLLSKDSSFILSDCLNQLKNLESVKISRISILLLLLLF